MRVARRLASECAGLVDVVPGHRTVLVTWDDEPEELMTLAEAALRDDQAPLAGASVEIPVRYDGPDLDEVARLTALSPEEVAARHLRAEYVVGFLGFAPGFAYLLGGDERLRVERRAEPRERVPAGSVALAGPYSGIYPRESPGGWQLIGSTTAVLFDAMRDPPALLSRRRPRSLRPRMIEVLAAGPLTTVQDRGRPGWAHLGVPPSGAADPQRSGARQPARRQRRRRGGARGDALRAAPALPTRLPLSRSPARRPRLPTDPSRSARGRCWSSGAS